MNQSQSPRADHHARAEITQHRAQPEMAEQGHGDHRCREENSCLSKK